MPILNHLWCQSSSPEMRLQTFPWRCWLFSLLLRINLVNLDPDFIFSRRFSSIDWVHHGHDFSLVSHNGHIMPDFDLINCVTISSSSDQAEHLLTIHLWTSVAAIPLSLNTAMSSLSTPATGKNGIAFSYGEEQLSVNVQCITSMELICTVPGGKE